MGLYPIYSEIAAPASRGRLAAGAKNRFIAEPYLSIVSFLTTILDFMEEYVSITQCGDGKAFTRIRGFAIQRRIQFGEDAMAGARIRDEKAATSAP